MKIFLIFSAIWGAMIAMSFWAVYVEGDKPWDRGKLGWHWKITSKITIPAFEFYIFAVMCPLFLALPLIVSGWDTKLFGVLVSAYFTGIILEDYLWFVVNPVVSIKQFNSRWADYYPWLKIGNFEIPWGYVFCLIISLLSWFFLWK
jgi:hypothetical protein